MTNPPQDKLMPCPFCGSDNVRVTGYPSCDCCGKAYNGSVTCQSCASNVSHFDDDQTAIAAWNTRPTTDVSTDGLVAHLRDMAAKLDAEKEPIFADEISGDYLKAAFCIAALERSNAEKDEALEQAESDLLNIGDGCGYRYQHEAIAKVVSAALGRVRKALSHSSEQSK